MAFRVPATAETAQSQLNRGYPGEVFQIPVGGLALDVDAIGTALTSSTGTKTVGSGITAGAVTTTLQPARKLTVTFDASTDWDPTNATITYVNHAGQTVSETLAIATSTTATTTGYAKSFTSIAIPAQTGTGGTATVGIAALGAGTLALTDAVGIVQRQFSKTMVNPSNLYVGPSSDGITSSATLAHYVDGDEVPCLQEGSIVVYTEEALVAGDALFVRIASGAGGALLGAFRNDSDSGSCVSVPNARVMGSWPAGAAEVQISNLYA
jgi:hypothetical protein